MGGVLKGWMGKTRAVVGGMALLGVLAAAAQGQVTFNHVFAPQEGPVAPVQKPDRDQLCLNGQWQFAPVAVPPGFAPGMSPVPDLPDPTADGWDKTPIRIPSPWNVNAFPDGENKGGDFRCFPSYPASWNNVQMGWLRRRFTVPAAWKNKRLLLHFDAVAGDTQVRINGKPVGTPHRDIFLPFDIDVTDAVRVGASNELLVGVRKMSLFDIPGKYGRRTYQGGSMWGQAIAGIWQDVTLEAVPAIRISDVFVQPTVDQDTLSAVVTLRNEIDQPASVRLSATTHAWSSQAGKDSISAPEPRGKLARETALALTNPDTVSVPAHGETTVTLAVKVNGKLKPWSPEQPNLYGLVCHLQDNRGGVTTIHDTAYTRFGWRQITFRANRVLLNGTPLTMKGDSWHFIGVPAMTRRYAWAWFQTLKNAHLNTVRLHAQPYPAFFLDVADEQGILVLDEDAIWASDGGPKIDSPDFWADTLPHLRGLILRDRNHPSVFGWSVSNEVMAVVRNVFHAPKEYEDQVIRYDGIWAGICRELDSTRPWISCDGEDDARGTLPTYVIHYGGIGDFEHASKTGKPWGVGEAGPAYYASPSEIEKQSGNPNVYFSFADRMAGVAAVSYQNLMDQRKFGGSYRSVFNLVWYGLKPLALGINDTTRPPALTDGVFFPPFVEGVPGVQPERIGPYSTSLNPGYDPRLPLYQTWPLFDAIRAAQADPPIPFASGRPITAKSSPVVPAITRRVVRAGVLSGPGGTLSLALADQGVSTVTTREVTPSVLFIDGAHPPGADAKRIMQRTLDAGGTVFIWGVSADTLPTLNALLPVPLALTGRTATSLVPVAPSALTQGLTPALLYFSEQNPAVILPAGLGGVLTTRSRILLTACDTDWKRWNGQPEMTKTASVLRSERETKPSGAALIELPIGKGRIVVCALPAIAQTAQALTLNRLLLANLEVALGDGAGERNALRPDGTIRHALALGRFAADDSSAALAASPFSPDAGPAVGAGNVVENHAWTPVTADPERGVLDLKSLDGKASPNTFVYLSVWVFSPKALDNLLLDPHLPNVDLIIGGASAAQAWLNARAVPVRAPSAEGIIAPTLLLQQGWNHLLIKVISAPGSDSSHHSLRLQSNQPDYLTQLRGAREKPQ